jgi:hypothetical protein
MRETKAPKGDSRRDKWWNWCTTSVPLNCERPNDGLKELLENYKSFFPVIRKHIGPDCDAYLELVTEYERGEEPRGLYLSCETIRLLNELGCAFGNDIVLRG